MNRKVPARIRKLMKELKEGLLRIYGDKMKAIYLYGSYARGQATPESDLDVLVVLHKDKQPIQSYIGGPGDIRWKKLVDAAIDSMVNKGPFVSVLVIGEDVFQSGFSISQAAREEGLVLWTAKQI